MYYLGLNVNFKGVVGITIVIILGWDLRKEVVFFNGWGMYLGRRSFFNIPESEVFQYLFYNFCLFYEGD